MRQMVVPASQGLTWRRTILVIAIGMLVLFEIETFLWLFMDTSLRAFSLHAPLVSSNCACASLYHQ